MKRRHALRTVAGYYLTPHEDGSVRTVRGFLVAHADVPTQLDLTAEEKATELAGLLSHVFPHDYVEVARAFEAAMSEAIDLHLVSVDVWRRMKAAGTIGEEFVPQELRDVIPDDLGGPF